MGASFGNYQNMSRFRNCGCYTVIFLLLVTIFLWTFEGNIKRSFGYQNTPSSLRPSDSHRIHDNSRPLAVVIETDETPNLIPLMLHFSAVLGPKWTVVLYTLASNWSIPVSPAFHRARQAGHIDVRFLPPDLRLTSSKAVSKFLTSPWLWEQVESAQRVLLWQTDSVLCSKSPQTVEDFFGYDFVGAPIDKKYGDGYNGGLSLRNPRLFLDITRSADFTKSDVEFEDQWFYKEARARVGNGVVLPTVESASVFSVETIYHNRPLGYHQPARWQSAHMKEIEEWCPEVKMLIGRRAK